MVLSLYEGLRTELLEVQQECSNSRRVPDRPEKQSG